MEDHVRFYIIHNQWNNSLDKEMDIFYVQSELVIRQTLVNTE